MAPACWAGSLRYCQGDTERDTSVQDRMLQVAAAVKAVLEQSGQRVSLVARSGLALQRFDQRYSHAGVSLQASPNAPWSVRQLYYACDEQRPRIFDQGMSGFVMGAQDPSEGYVSMLLLPPDAADALEHAALDNARALHLLGGHYSANAYAFSQRYQNCNQWLVELLANAWDTAPRGDDARLQAQRWLAAQGYAPTVMNLGWQPLMWLADQIRWLHSDDHPADDLAAAQFRVSMPASIESFVHANMPGATRVELCYTDHHLIVHQGWEPIAPGCIPGENDTVTSLTNLPPG